MQQEEAGPPEPGFLTATQWQRKLNRKSAQTRALCKAAWEAGEMERKMFKVDFGGSKRSIAHYRLIAPSQSGRSSAGTAS